MTCKQCGGIMTVDKQRELFVCPFCGAISNIPCDEDALAQYDAGALVQDAFPYLSADEREMLISGICPTCWNDTFFDEEEEKLWESLR